jgi:hypothetical protein
MIAGRPLWVDTFEARLPRRSPVHPMVSPHGSGGFPGW